MTNPHTFTLDGLQLGVATCALQIEGGDRNNQWYDWAQIPGRIKDGSTPLRATDHWNRWREDTDLMAELGIQTYRMGLEWARIEPAPGEFDAAVLDRYREELEALQDRGIQPLVTLHHFTNPRWFEEMGAWTSDRAVETFVRFVGVCADHLGDLVTDWCTINEPNVYALGSYLSGDFPPGGHNEWKPLRATLRAMARAHCAAYTLLHERVPNARVGFAHHLRVFDPLNPRNPVHRAFAKANSYLFQDALTDAFLGGKFARVLGGQPAEVTPGTYYDYLGINYYSGTATSKLDDGTFPFSPINDLGWEIYPEGLAQVAERLHARYPGPIWITENGTCDNSDAFRSRYLFDHLAVIAASSLPFERYYHWCFVDNWEWAEGEIPRFGLVALDYETQTRTVKDSGRFYAGIIAAGGVTEDLYAAHVAAQTYHRAGATPQPRG